MELFLSLTVVLMHRDIWLAEVSVQSADKKRQPIGLNMTGPQWVNFTKHNAKKMTKKYQELSIPKNALLSWWSVRHNNGLVQDCSNSSVLVLEILQSRTKPFIYPLLIIRIIWVPKGRSVTDKPSWLKPAYSRHRLPAGDLGNKQDCWEWDEQLKFCMRNFFCYATST